jgi:hypothetical protein
MINNEWKKEFDERFVDNTGTFPVMKTAGDLIDPEPIKSFISDLLKKEREKAVEERVQQRIDEVIRNPIRGIDGVANYEYNMGYLDALQALTPTITSDKTADND